MLRAQTVGATSVTQFKLSDTPIDRLNINNRYPVRLTKIIICDRSSQNIEIAFSIEVVVRSRINRTEMVGKSVRHDPLVIRTVNVHVLSNILMKFARSALQKFWNTLIHNIIK